MKKEALRIHCYYWAVQVISVVLYSVNENEEQGERAVSPPLNSSDIGIGLIFQSHLWQESKLV